jgi:nitrogen-specific signal transduction histidine kinase/CheY-like chemotaxis protein
VTKLLDAAGKPVGLASTERDLTARRKLEEQFRQSQKMEAIGMLAGGVAHDFNNILAVIQMQASLLKCGGDLSAGQTELADDIGIAVQRAAALTRQLLLFSRKQVLQPRDLDLNHTVNEMAKMLARTLGENIAMQLNLAAQPMFLHADAGMMDQVLMNLAVNARDAMLEGGQLVIETAGVEFDEFAARQTAQARPGSFVRLSVSDNGCGIPPGNLSKIFEPFFTTKGVGKGTGLGLATVFGIAKQHLGWVNVCSEVGHGTTFKVYLPRLAESHDTTFIRKMPATAQTGHETILLVEDEPALRTIIEKTLTRLGYRVLEASTGFKALKVWKEHPAEIHLLLTDLMMPDGMSGKELGQRLLQENPKLKVIYMRGYSADIVAKDFPLQEGVNFLIKPFQSQKLAEIIRNILDKDIIV